MGKSLPKEGKLVRDSLNLSVRSHSRIPSYKTITYAEDLGQTPTNSLTVGSVSDSP